MDIPIPKPFDLPDADRPFAEDTEHATYDPVAAHRYWRVLSHTFDIAHSFGFWFGDDTFVEPAFYSYTEPGDRQGPQGREGQAPARRDHPPCSPRASLSGLLKRPSKHWTTPPARTR
ncbi:DUF5996 family protein [Streptomyces sp. NPDC007205]|uniref:DUF5996 family protein n=1 Tax=Streptomyces sp. NPDC007205 TaxID=3154316 RepID=UPI0033C7D7C7